MAAVKDRGLKRICTECGTRFYDFSKRPIICPSCETEFVIDTKTRKGRDKSAANDEETKATPDKAEDESKKSKPKKESESEDSGDEVSLDDIDEDGDDEDEDLNLGEGDIDLDDIDDIDDDTDFDEEDDR